MPETDLVLLFTRRLEDAGFIYMITGSVAGVFYGEPRVTHDVDLVLAAPAKDAGRIAAAFPLDEFYCPPEEVIVQEALRPQRGHFNLIHHETGFKADIYLANRDEFHRWALSERQQVAVDDWHVHLAPVEYVIVRKLEYFREGGSQKHLSDIQAMRRISGDQLRSAILEKWARRVGVWEQWELLAAQEAD